MEGGFGGLSGFGRLRYVPLITIEVSCGPANRVASKEHTKSE